jgi:hypothetical protein
MTRKHGTVYGNVASSENCIAFQEHPVVVGDKKNGVPGVQRNGRAGPDRIDFSMRQVPAANPSESE